MQSKTANAPAWMIRLAADFLVQYAERLGNDGCNDYDVPEWVPIDELRDILKDWNNDDDAEGLEGYNWAVVAAIANELLGMLPPEQGAADAH